MSNHIHTHSFEYIFSPPTTPSQPTLTEKEERIFICEKFGIEIAAYGKVPLLLLPPDATTESVPRVMRTFGIRMNFSFSLAHENPTEKELHVCEKKGLAHVWLFHTLSLIFLS
jgi:hypothetical protein